MRIGVLGSLTVCDEAGRPVEVGGQLVRKLLLVLALDAGRIVPAYSLIERLWDDVRNGDALMPKRRSPIGHEDSHGC